MKLSLKRLHCTLSVQLMGESTLFISIPPCWCVWVFLILGNCNLCPCWHWWCMQPSAIYACFFYLGLPLCDQTWDQTTLIVLHFAPQFHYASWRKGGLQFSLPAKCV